MNPLAGITVLERAGPLSVAACGHLLALLGARVIRIEDERQRARATSVPPQIARLHVHGKERLPVAPKTADALWTEQLAHADVVLLAPPLATEFDRAIVSDLIAAPGPRVVCAFSLAGHDQPDLPTDASDPLLQALGGLMAVTGQPGGPPEFARVPVAQLNAAVVGTTSVCAALLKRRETGRGQLIDLSLIEVLADQLRTHIGLVRTGQTTGFRNGCQHPLCCPWNTYRARDGWILICSSGDAHWHALLDLMGRADLKADPRYLTMKARREHADEVDALIQDWTRTLDMREAIAALIAIEVPVGPVLDPTEVPNDAMLRDAGTVTPADEAPQIYALSPWRYRARTEASHTSVRTEASRGAPDALPLAGVRVVELTRYAAGPLAGYILAGLGAEVIKIEPPGGEECRTWSPRFGDTSGYFINYNAGKTCIGLDLRDAAAREQLDRLIASADVVLHNMRPGAMERLGLGADALCRKDPRLVYAAVSGFGPEGPKLPALDTVIQAHVGLTRLVGSAETPARVGYSIADQLAGHFAAAGIVAALLKRSRSGIGGAVEVAMADTIAWLTHLAWTGESAIPPAVRIATRDGWIVAGVECMDTAEHTNLGAMSRDQAVASLARRGIAAAPVLDVDEVLAHPTIESRGSLYDVEVPGGGTAPLFAAPLGMPRARPPRMTPLHAGADVPIPSKDTIS